MDITRGKNRKGSLFLSDKSVRLAGSMSVCWSVHHTPPSSPFVAGVCLFVCLYLAWDGLNLHIFPSVSQFSIQSESESESGKYISR